MSVPEQSSEIDDHKITLTELYQRYNTDPKIGLTDAKVEEIFNRYGPNILSQSKTTVEWMKLCRQIFGGFAFLFWICACLCFIVYGLTTKTYHDNDASINYLWLGIVFIFIIIINGFFSYYEELKSSRIMDTMKNINSQVFVLRNGEKKKIDIKDLVIGDIIEINSGDIIPADIRIIESDDFKVNNSSLTGDSELQSRSAEFTNENPLETKNLVFYSTVATEGTATGLVIRTRNHTILDNIFKSIGNQTTDDTPLIKEISQSTYSITRIAIILGIFFFIIALSLGYPLIESIILLIVVIIVHVPKCLSITVTICLSLIVKRMARKNCLVRKLKAIELLGSTSIMCMDKNGVLTQNQLAVTHMWFDNKLIQVDISEKEDLSTFDKNSSTFLDLARCTVLCNRADFKQDSDNLARSIIERECTGNASEIAVLKYIELSNGNVNKIRQENPKLYEIPFNSMNKYQLSIHEMHVNNENGDNSHSYLLVMKGGFEQIMERCSTISIDGVDLEMNEYWRATCEHAYSELGNLGERTMTFCDLRLPANEYPIGYSFDVDEVNFPTENLRFLGLVGMSDPPKRAIPDMIKKCRSAGIKMIMITGDNAITAKATARAVNIISNDSETIDDIAERLGIPVESVNSSDAKACVIQGNDLYNKSPEEIDALLNNYAEIVFARISPRDKVSIAEGKYEIIDKERLRSMLCLACQRQGGIVTITGEGTNDVPALQQASVKVVMGIAGTNTCKQAGDILLVHDNFASILTGVEQGRLLFANLKKSIVYTMTSNIAKIMSLLICLLTTVPLAWGIITVLCIDFINITGAISLAYEKAETDIMKRPPRNPKNTRSIVVFSSILLASSFIGIIQVATGFFAYFLIMINNSYGQQWVRIYLF
ncbi:unnamed protein product, partial [Adineta steineri]